MFIHAIRCANAYIPSISYGIYLIGGRNSKEFTPKNYLLKVDALNYDFRVHGLEI